MSEFKFACPVCGQHIKCDSSQAGTVMDCPTCFQKITVPQAPSDESQKLILTGTQVVDKPVFTRGLEGSSRVGGRHFPGAWVVVLILLFMSTAAAAIYWATIIHPRQTLAAGAHGADAPAMTSSSRPVKPPPVAPPASDSNWTLALETNSVIPGSPVAGRIHSQNFIVERAAFQNGSLTLRWGSRSTLEFGAIINFGGLSAEELSGKNIDVTTNADKAARVTLRWKDENGKVQKQNFDSDYAMRLEFGALAKNHLPGKIYLCTPDDDKSYLLGSFNADARKPKPKGPPKPR